MDNNQRSDLIVRTAAKLPPEDRVRVAERILDVKDEPVLNAYHRCADLVAIAEQVVGDVLDNTRKYNSVTIRRFVSWRMRQEGYTFYDIARALDVDHSTVHHYVRCMKEELDLPSVFRNDLGLYQSFNDHVEQVRQ